MNKITGILTLLAFVRLMYQFLFHRKFKTPFIPSTSPLLLFLIGWIFVLDGWAQPGNEYTGQYQKLKVKTVTERYYVYDKSVLSDSADLSITYLNRFGKPDSIGSWIGNVFLKDFLYRYNQYGKPVFICYYGNWLSPTSHAVTHTTMLSYQDSLLTQVVSLDAQNDTMTKSHYYYNTSGKLQRLVQYMYKGQPNKRILLYDTLGNHISDEFVVNEKTINSTKRIFSTKKLLLEETHHDFRDKTGSRNTFNYDEQGNLLKATYETFGEKKQRHTETQENRYEKINGHKWLVKTKSNQSGQLERESYKYHFNPDGTYVQNLTRKNKNRGFFSFLHFYKKHHCSTLHNLKDSLEQSTCFLEHSKAIQWYNKQGTILSLTLTPKGDTLRFFEKRFDINGLPTEEKTISFWYTNQQHPQLLDKRIERTCYIYHYFDPAEKP